MKKRSLHKTYRAVAWWRRFSIFIKLILLIVVSTYILYNLFTQIFRITEIQVIGNDVQIEINPEKINHNLLFFPADSLKNELLKGNIHVEDVKFIKKFPHTLVVEFILRKPVAKLKTKEKTFLIDKKGIVLGDANLYSGDYPVIYSGLDHAETGTYIKDKGVLAALSFLESLDATISVNRVVIDESSFLKAKYDKTDIFCLFTADMDKTADTLQTLITRFRMKGTMPTRIDLRFDKPVVIF